MADKSKSKTKKTTQNKPKSDSFCWFVLKLILSQSYLVVAISCFIAFIPLNDFPFNAQSYETPDYAKVLAPFLKESSSGLSYKLDDSSKTRKLFKGYPGPEAFVYDIGLDSFFTGLADGRIMKINGKLDKIELFTRLSSNATAEKCDGKIHKSDECGRPLGLEIAGGNLYVVDAVNGLYSVNLKTKQSHHIPINAYLSNVLDEKIINNLLYNDIVFDPVKSNLAYITVSTTKFRMNQLPFSLLEHENSGLLLAVDLANKNGTVINKDLYFANGIEISSNKEHVYVSETTTYSISKLNLKQLRESIYLNKGELPKLEPFIDGLLGEPDNLHTKNGKLYVSFAIIRLDGPLLSDYLAQLPLIRTFVSKSFFIISKLVHLIRQTILENKFNYKSEFLKELEFKFYSGHIVYSFVKQQGGLAVYSESTGKLVEVLGSKTYGFLSHAYIHPKTNEILVGSFKNDFISVVKP